MNCKSCDEPLETDWLECPVCETLVNTTTACSNCGKELKSKWVKCPYCRTPTGVSGSQGSTGNEGLGMDSTQSGISGYSMRMNFTQAGSRSSAPHIELNPGDEVGNYSIHSLLGRGGFGSVYRATESLLEEEHAVKVLPLISRDYVRNILLEFKSRDRIRNFDHILRAWQPVQTIHNGQDVLLYPMDLAETTLRYWMQQHRSDSEQFLSKGLELFIQACKGVQAIHEAGLTHLDLKPDNILLARDTKEPDSWVAKIGDFGLARGAGMETLQGLEDGAGTPAYMAPEQIMAARWKDVGAEADIYALGMILYELLDGDLPYSGTPAQIKHKKRDVTIAISRPQGPEHLVDLVMACLERDKTKRPASVNQLMEGLVTKKQPAKKQSSSESNSSEKQKSLSTHWHPDYIKWLKNHIDPAGAIFHANDAYEVTGLPVFDLIDSGILNKYKFSNGKHVALFSLSRLIRSQSMEIIHEVFSVLLKVEIERDSLFYLKLFIDSNEAKSRYELEKVVSRTKDSDLLVTYAIAFKYLFNSENETKSCLEKAETFAESSFNWSECAECWKDLFADDREARRCLEKAESVAKSSFDWYVSAKTWKELFVDDREAGRCLERAESIADSIYSWLACAKGWKELYGDDQEAQRCLEKAESIADHIYDWKICASFWNEVMGDGSKARRCLEMAESFAKHSHSWIICAEGWVDVFGDEREARRCLDKGESIAQKSFTNWESCAEGWIKIFGDEREARRCLEKAELAKESIIEPLEKLSSILKDIDLKNYNDRFK